jgi:hypothetical protein
LPPLPPTSSSLLNRLMKLRQKPGANASGFHLYCYDDENVDIACDIPLSFKNTTNFFIFNAFLYTT